MSVRTFNQFYTRRLGMLNARFLGTTLTHGEARILLEIARSGPVLGTDLSQQLDMDPAHISRLLARFEAKGWVHRERGEHDARARPVTLTTEGESMFRTIDQRQTKATGAMLADQDRWGKSDIVQGLTLARLRLAPASGENVTFRTFGCGDIGMIAARQSRLYAEEQEWGVKLEVLITDTAAAFLHNFREGRDQCWIAELDGVMAGSVMLTDEGEGTARLRLLYVEPFARNRSIAAGLIARCITFARDAGYGRITLWTHTVLEGARRLYVRNGFQLKETQIHTAFGEPIQGETWTLDLS